MIIDIAWLVSLARDLWLPNLDYRLKLFILRLAWGFTAIYYQSLALFIECLSSKNFKFNIRHKASVVITSAFFIFAALLAFVDINCKNTALRPKLEFIIRNAEGFFSLFFVLFISLAITAWKYKNKALPRIIKKQLGLLMAGFILPMWISDVIQFFPIAFSPTWSTNSYAAVSMSGALLSLAMYYCSKKIISLRFLNLSSHVTSRARLNFVDGFKEILERLSYATSIKELEHISQTLFKETFDIPLNKTTLYVRSPHTAAQHNHEVNLLRITPLVENFLETHAAGRDYIKNAKILIYDEIAFNNFYEKDAGHQTILTFMDTINADIFVPIYEKDTLVGYIIVDRYARLKQFYSNVERDEMLVYASYLGNIINLLQNKNLESLLHQEKELKEELYLKHQEINQYKESIRSFLRSSRQKNIGIIFYKNRRFIFGNQTAKEMININLNTQQGHPLAKALDTVARQVSEYKSPQTRFATDENGSKIVLCGVPNLERNNVIITVYYPEISDIIRRQLDTLHDPTQWDYLLYLETTQSGKLISQLIPGSSEKLLNFKIALLKTALGKKAMLLQMPEADLLSTVELIHHISLRDSLHVLKLHGPEQNNESAMKIFGINPLFGIPVDTTPLLEKLDGTGTLFIQNIHLLSMETQEHLAEYLKYGLYRLFKSDQKVASNVRVICSTNQNLQALVQEGTFSKALYNELNQTSLSLPSLLTLPEEELNLLADGFSQQALKTNDLKNLLELTERDKHKLINARPASLHELKNKVQQILINKSKKNHVYDDAQFDPAYQLSDPQLVEAARLGKYALKDPKLMAMLWHKFKSQSKIATFLGVNRSSVNRRVKEYNLTS